jgi:hypothetical protein
MNTLARLNATQAASRPERRKVSRYPAEVTAMLYSSHGDEASVLLADVSTHGCNVKGEVAWLRTGSFVSIGLGNEPPLRAIVRWIRDGAAGMEFLWPVSSAQGEWHALMQSPFGG